MKALEILNEVNGLIKRSRDYDFTVQIHFSKAYQIRVKKAIKELENLQNKSCENCKHNKEQDNFMIFCDKEMCQDGSKIMWHSLTKDFSCNKWESKQ